ncbi:thioesterase [Kordia sp. YSTF-M3]|uniref:Thioesterase n=1 Tax=Kordia aestuariivivens TaxID=2759037 RepID=A0ABR7QD96_9FLAO|nr:thioesterase [Kordia aestuariivivens]MBC8756498.1 thioesterase [Kordia aestuariivivens]
MKKKEERTKTIIKTTYPLQRHQLFLLHFAGGSKYSFDSLKEHLGMHIDFLPLEIPGRGKRFKEALLKSKTEAVQDYCQQIKTLRNEQPYIIYGHSMGATLGLNIVAELEKENDAPVHLILSGNSGPGIKEYVGGKELPKRYSMNDIKFKEELRRLGGVPEEVLENNELYDLFSPIMRADFEILEKEENSEKGLMIHTPIHAMMGSEEKTKDHIANWKKFTSKKFTSEIVEGNHFFINEHPQKIAEVINAISSQPPKMTKSIFI